MSYNVIQFQPIGALAPVGWQSQPVTPEIARARKDVFRHRQRPDFMRALAERALNHYRPAKRVSFRRFEWDVRGSCKSPHEIQHWSGGDRLVLGPRQENGEVFQHKKVGQRATVMRERNAQPFLVSMWVPCRKCAACRRWKREEWTNRAIAERADLIAAAKARGDAKPPRIWASTLTLSEPELFKMKLRAEKRRRERGGWPKPPTAYQLYADVCEMLGYENQKYFKRLRAAGARFRYLMVFEGENGRVHCHMLLFEVVAGDLKKADLEAQWKSMGFSHHRLVHDDDQLRYVTKYIGKEGTVAPRASLRFGKVAKLQSEARAEAQRAAFELARLREAAEAEYAIVLKEREEAAAVVATRPEVIPAGLWSSLTACFPDCRVVGVTPLERSPGGGEQSASFEEERIAYHQQEVGACSAWRLALAGEPAQRYGPNFVGPVFEAPPSVRPALPLWRSMAEYEAWDKEQTRLEREIGRSGTMPETSGAGCE